MFWYYPPQVEDIINESDESDGGEGDAENEEGEMFNADQVGEGEDTQERELKKVLRGDVPSESESEESMSGGTYTNQHLYYYLMIRQSALI